MVFAWLVYLLAVIIFAVVGATGIFHAKKYKIKGDLSDFAVTLYLFFMISLIVLTIVLVLSNGANAPIDIPILRGGK